ncbi:MAG: aminopeptidase [Anaerolineales bacterium]|nr:aminopeptidase [Anaerolineales bacterium]
MCFDNLADKISVDSLPWERLADRILDYSLALQLGENFLVSMTSIESYPLAAALVAGAVRRGAHPQIIMRPSEIDDLIRQVGTDEQAARSLSMELFGMNWADVYVDLRSLIPPVIRATASDYDRRAALLQSARGDVSTARWSQTRWCIVRVPTSDYAAYLGRPVDALFDDFFRGSVDDDGWRQWSDLAARLEDSRAVRIMTDDTDLTFSVAGRKWVLFDGKNNLPDGEIATAPLEHTATGYIEFPDALVFSGRRIKGLRMEFEYGRVTKVDAGPNSGFVKAILASDDGATRIGEFGIGLNSHIKDWTEDLFYDEKIVGTIHIALGRAYKECGGTNLSAIHWDLVKDLRPSESRKKGVVTIDDTVIIDGTNLLFL